MSNSTDSQSKPPSQKLRGRKRRFALWVLLIGTLFLAVAAFIASVWILKLDREIAERFQQKRFAPPVEFYSAPEFIKTGYRLSPADLMAVFARRGYRLREFGQPIQPADVSRWSGSNCLAILPATTGAVGSATGGTAGGAGGADADSAAGDSARSESSTATNRTITDCIAFRHQTPTETLVGPTTSTDPDATPRPSFSAPSEPAQTEPVQIVAFDAQSNVVGTYAGANPHASENAVLDPELFAQYYGDKPILRNVVDLGQIPPLCKDALLAIEDPQFLEHSGISFTSLLRAVVANLRHGRFAQGGSTITQQLVKNYFLTEEKTLSRKLTEIAMSFLVERRASKEDILETYLNLIYMGQNGPFEVRGFAAAAQHYFAKPIQTLETEQCALLAAILNSPGLYNPFTRPDAARKRRTRVLEKMRDSGHISAQAFAAADAAPLPKAPGRVLTEPAPYFVRAVRKELEKMGLDLSQGLRVYTTLDLRAQEAAQKAVRSGLEKLESSVASLRKLKEKGKNLEALLIASDPSSGFITAIVGGRSYVATQYNRAVESRRQVGSIMKPFVYLAALEGKNPNGDPYLATTEIDDSTFALKYEGQSWTPKNYDGKSRGMIPMWYGLVESLNSATARLGWSIGIKNVISVARKLGIESKLEPLPSLSLGAFELSPMEVLGAYTSLARLGTHVPLSSIYRVEDLGGSELFAFRPTEEKAVSPESAAVLVSMLKAVVDHGTGRGARTMGLTGAIAGKTGTTNDKKDAWFAGFSPEMAAVVWVGYDDNTPHGLTGGGGAVPIWAQFMLGAQKLSAEAAAKREFQWPEGVEPITVELGDLEKYPILRDEIKQPVQLIERKRSSGLKSFF